jgi:hypothetical protein
MLLVSRQEELGLTSERTLEDSVIIIVGGDDANALRGLNKVGNGADGTHSCTGFLFAKAELLPQHTLEL